MGGGSGKRYFGSGSCCCCTRKQALYIVGLVLMGIGLSGMMMGFFSVAWVFREGGTQLTIDSVERYGLWEACAPKDFDVCSSIVKSMPGIASAAKGSQALLTISLVFVVLGFLAEIMSCLPIAITQGKFRIIFDNRVIEYVISIAAVVGFVGMLIFAGEVKNRAEREIGQEDTSGGGFRFSLSGLMMVVVGCCLLACGRDVKLTTV